MNWRQEQAQVFDEITRRSKTGYQYIYTDGTIQLLKNIIPKKGKILDLACGGNYVEILKRDWYGVDISKETVNALKGKYKKILFGDVTKRIPFPDNYFDYVFAASILHHIYKEIPSAIREVRRVLKPGGEVIIIDHDSRDTRTRMMHHGPLRIVPCKSEKALDIKEISSMLINNGFELKETKMIKVYAEQQALKPPFLVRLIKVPFLLFFGELGTKTKGDFLMRAKVIK